MSDDKHLISLLESAKAQFGASALRRLETPLRVTAGLEQRAAADPSRSPGGIFIPELTAAPWHPSDWLPDAPLLESAALAIRAELDGLLARREGFQPYDEGEYGFNPTNLDGQWNVYYLYLEDRVVPQAEAACPRTVAALRTLPNLAVSAMFSALTPGTHIEPHCGPTNAIVSLSLGLIIPADCTIRVGTETREWREGKCLVFDDTYEHEVWNRGAGTRIVLLLDAWHPELTPIERMVLSRALWRPGEANEFFQRQRNMLDGQTWWMSSTQSE